MAIPKGRQFLRALVRKFPRPGVEAKHKVSMHKHRKYKSAPVMKKIPSFCLEILKVSLLNT